MRVGQVIADGDRSFLSRWRWPVALGAMALTALAFVVLGALEAWKSWFIPRPTLSACPSAQPHSAPRLPKFHVRRYARSTALPSSSMKPAALQRARSGYRGWAGDASQAVRDADLTYKSSSGAVCLDYDWAANQCLHITKGAVSKVDCLHRGAVLPDFAIIGAVDVTYCREGGIAHSVRHFTVCTLAGDKNRKGRTRGS